MLRTPSLILALIAALPGAACKQEHPADDSRGQLDADDQETDDPANGEPEPGNPEAEATHSLPPAPAPADAPIGLPERPEAGDPDIAAAQVALGELLFFDARISDQAKLSCQSCHVPELGFADGRRRSITRSGRPNLRHTPSLVNLAYQREYYWDGRSLDLEGALLSHWRGQLGIDPARAAAHLAEIPDYRAHFRRAFEREPDAESAATALASFARVLHSGGSPWDRYEAGELGAVPARAVAGARVFSERAGCGVCHTPPLYTDLGYHARAVGERLPGGALLDGGRQRVTGRSEELGAFKTPTLRGILVTAPYFHDGSAATLAEAVAHELSRQKLSVPLSAAERGELLAFLVALSPVPMPRPRPSLPRELPLGLQAGDDTLGLPRPLPPIIEESRPR